MGEIEQMTIEELKKWITETREKYVLELKTASVLPKSFWETYSSFSNTSGGIVILGVREALPFNQIEGVGNADNILTDLWNLVSNPEKVSYKNIDNQDVIVQEIDGKKIVIICIKEAPEIKKPVYIGNKIENTWIRTGDGDRKATKEEIAAFIRNAQPGQDTLLAEGFTMDDLDSDSVVSFRERISKRFPNKNYNEMNYEKFLTEIGACSLDRTTGELKIKRGTILFLGKCNSIKELYPHFHLDFFNRRGKNARWIDRVSDDEPGAWEMNIYNFYTIVYEKMRTSLKESFEVDMYQQRLPISGYDETIREGLINCLAHADYVQGYPSTKIEMYDGWIRFSNPGKMLVSVSQFILGGDSRPRNEIVMKMFRLLGMSERQGFGGPLIYKSAVKNDYKRPEITSDLEKTELVIWNIDLADAYPDLSSDEKTTLRYISKKAKPVGIKEIVESLGLTDYKARKAVAGLTDRDLLVKKGNGTATRYAVSMENTEYFTKLEIMMEKLKRSMV